MAIKVNATLRGGAVVFARLNRELLAVEGRTHNGMYAAVKHLEFQMDTVSPMVPEDTRNMRKSWYILGAKRAMNPIINAGYRAPYAGYVHEAWHVQNWTRPGSGAKWLQIHFARNIEEMKLIIAANARVKGTGSYGGYGFASATPLSQRTGNAKGTFNL